MFVDLNCTTLPGSCISLQMSMLFIIIDTILLLSHFLGFLHRETEHIAPLSTDVISTYPNATAFFRVQTWTDNKMYCPLVPSGLLLFVAFPTILLTKALRKLIITFSRTKASTADGVKWLHYSCRA